MISTSACIVCGNPGLERSPGRIAPFIAHRCGLDPAAGAERAWCPRCDLLFFDPRLAEPEVRRLYVGYRDAAYVRERTRFEPSYPARHPLLVDTSDELHRNRILALQQSFAGLGRAAGRVLDFGGGDGWLTHGAFPGGDIVVYDLADGLAPPPPRSFDLVLCAHVLEHVSFPVPFVRELIRYLKPGGLVYLEVPGPGRQPPGASVFDYMGPAMHEHVSFFSGRALLALLQRCGLEPLWSLAVKEVTQVFARVAPGPPAAGPDEWFRPDSLPAPVRGAGGSDSCDPGSNS
jgi:SAM-dependent methyltransferase